MKRSGMVVGRFHSSITSPLPAGVKVCAGGSDSAGACGWGAVLSVALVEESELVNLSRRLIGCRLELRNWIGVDPEGRSLLVEYVSVSRPCRTAAVIRGTMDSTTEAMSLERSWMGGWADVAGIA